MQAQDAGMYADNKTGPRFSDTPLIQPAQPTGKAYRTTIGDQAGAPRPPATSPAEHRSWVDTLLDTDQLQQFLASSAALPAVAGVLLLLSHFSTIFRWLQGVSVIDIIAFSCLAVSAVLAAPKVIIMVVRAVTAFNALSTAVVRLPEMADNIAVLSSTVNQIQRDPAPRHWLDMYYNMVSDIDNLLQETMQLRKVMSDIHSDADGESVKDKTWRRKGSRSERR
ncbi:TPA: hypothetical protein ACH3X1_004380 [Trebouxia sp. C0004]